MGAGGRTGQGIDLGDPQRILLAEADLVQPDLGHPGTLKKEVNQPSAPGFGNLDRSLIPGDAFIGVLGTQFDHPRRRGRPRAFAVLRNGPRQLDRIRQVGPEPSLRHAFVAGIQREAPLSSEGQEIRRPCCGPA